MSVNEIVLKLTIFNIEVLVLTILVYSENKFEEFEEQIKKVEAAKYKVIRMIRIS